MTEFLSKKILWSLVFSAVALIVLWMLSEVLKPFIFSIILAYCLNPIVNRIEQNGIARFVAVIAVMFLSVGFIILSAVIILPQIISQIQALISITPDLLLVFLSKINEYFPGFFKDGTLSDKGFSFLKNHIGAKGVTVAKEIFSYSIAIFDTIILLFVVPVVTFYLLADWNTLLDRMRGLLPKSSRSQVLKVVMEIDQVLSSFLRGQLIICTLLAFLYSAGLLVVNLEYAILIGCFAGFISFIPFIGAILGAVIALWVAVFQFWADPFQIGLVAAVFLFGQLLESNFLTPKLVGKAICLHPVWIIFSLSVGGALAGLSGVMLAVPVAAIVGVLVRHTIRDLRY